jgi:hypothetical protein
LALQEIQEEEATRKALVTIGPYCGTSGWASALYVTALRDELRSAGGDASVRGIARALSWSSGQVGDLLKIREAFPEPAVDWLGFTRDDRGEDPLEFSERGRRRLELLSFRCLRSVARLPYGERLIKVREVAKSALMANPASERANLTPRADAVR